MSSELKGSEENRQPETDDATAAGPEQATSDIENLPPPPPASFLLLVSTLGTQAMAAMGQLPGPADSQPAVRLDYAQNSIDMLALLEQKTKGNLTNEEIQGLGNWLYQLRMIYIHVSKGK